ncbi:hypothetical protein DVW87_00645 [Sphingomonas aracearum]|uniref:Uncharacterized protein n=2 Tax=Sphingomonas aracearum TaxID=2283317 RepID=A0A369VXF5_9SPHN|nr:hypothetical protein DVW87_00645 [Sphingomonas aracearum]
MLVVFGLLSLVPAVVTLALPARWMLIWSPACMLGIYLLTESAFSTDPGPAGLFLAIWVMLATGSNLFATLARLILLLSPRRAYR